MRIAVFFSNPIDTSRLELDREHRAIDQLLARSGIPAQSFVRCHATTVDDMISVVAKEAFDVIHFSGHGNKSGIVLSTAERNSSQHLTASRLAEVLQMSPKAPKAILLLSCYSAECLPILGPCAPFVVSVYGRADDQAAIEFCGAFYMEFSRAHAVEAAFY